MWIDTHYGKGFIALFLLIVLVGILLIGKDSERHQDDPSTLTAISPIEYKQARDAYFFRILRDPKTNQIPPQIRQRELMHAQRIATENASKIASADFFRWSEVGPNNVGGRTRALAADLTNPETILAGGVSGGMWKSTDGGATWTLKSEPTQNLSVTYVAQDPRPGHTRVWYYASGEFRGQTAEDRGARASFYGMGLYKSTDNGETWDRLAATLDSNRTILDSPFDFVSKIAISPTTGRLYVATHEFGIYASDDAGASFKRVLGIPEVHNYADVAIASDGTVLASLSRGSNTLPAGASPGLYVSRDDGRTWTDVTPSDYPSYYNRSVLAIAPSNPDVAYVLTSERIFINEIVIFYRLDLASGTNENLTANLPEFSSFGSLRTQRSYNMALAVKPDDENFVLVGGVSLFRSRDGFQTRSTDKQETWIGGYHPEPGPSLRAEQYPGHHADQHVLWFDPADPNRVWSGHDGGISVTSDITASHVTWTPRNEGFNVTQFYTVALSREARDHRILGGTQDNGTPYMRWETHQSVGASNIGAGDGSYAYLGQDYAYVSAQRGIVIRLTFDEAGNPKNVDDGYDIVSPPETLGRLFIHPFAVDPNDEQVMYYPIEDELWRHTHIGDPVLPADSLRGWEHVYTTPLIGEDITALTVSVSPAHVAYFGTSDHADPPEIYRLEDARHSTRRPTRLSLPSAPGGAYIHDIAVNPDDADEVLVVLSNYNIVGLYHSDDGGETFTAVEGNLEGTEAFPGPSLRSATILPTAEKTIYAVGTSTGLYATDNLIGSLTHWVQQAPDELGNVVVEQVTSRKSDGVVAVATHGRGLFVGSLQDQEDIEPAIEAPLFILDRNYPNPFRNRTQLRINLKESSEVSIAIYDVVGRRVQDVLRAQQLEAGRYDWPIDLPFLASGLYFYRVDVRSMTSRRHASLTGKMTVLR